MDPTTYLLLVKMKSFKLKTTGLFNLVGIAVGQRHDTQTAVRLNVFNFISSLMRKVTLRSAKFEGSVKLVNVCV